jgi:hypothetical protein
MNVLPDCYKKAILAERSKSGQWEAHQVHDQLSSPKIAPENVLSQ